MVEPPEKMDEASVVGRYQDEPIKAGILMEKIVDGSEELHYKYRSGKYDLDVRIDFEIGRGQVKVEEAPGYE